MSSRPASARASLERERQAAQRRRERRQQVVVALALVLVLVGGGLGYQLYRTSRSPSAVPRAAAATLTPVPVVTGQPLLLGAADAPVKVRLYEDFHCEHCVDFEERLGETLNREQDAGRVVIELYPMSFIDEGSGPAANAMACAAEAGFGRDYYSGLFANATLSWNDDQLIELADQVTPSAPGSFRSCVTTKAHQPWVDSINAAANASDVHSTPTVFVAGAPVEPSVTPAELTALIDRAATSGKR
jgi:protein-disulfide isomerase